MVDSFKQVTSRGRNKRYLKVIVENHGWSKLKPVLGFSSSRAPQTRRPSPLLLSRKVAIEGVVGTRDELRLREPTFDLGLGCFGQPLRAADGGDSEANLWWTDYYRIKIPQEIFDGRRIYGFEEIDLH
ncbi:hypothetical protein F5X98DRAFT_328719 [Xylaria grammica]|nr:hypothetical protein F5X98DRAFT_328719 [Xylaria grammica]